MSFGGRAPPGPMGAYSAAQSPWGWASGEKWEAEKEQRMDVAKETEEKEEL